MKKIILLLALLSTFGITHTYAMSPVLAFSMEKMNVSSIDEIVAQNTESHLAGFEGRKGPIVVTYDVEVVSEKGSDYFIAYYPELYTITALNGPYFGKQIICSYPDTLVGGSESFHYETIGGEEMMVHEYIEGKIYTGKTVQMIHID